MDRREFIRLAFWFGAGLALNSLIPNKAFSQEKQNFQSIDVKLVPFKEYDISPETNNATIEDNILERYIKKPYSLDELGQSITDSRLIKKIENDPIRNIKIADYKKFESDVLSAAKKLRYTVDDIKKLSVKDAIMLSGRIVADKLDYNPKMIGEKEKIIDKAISENPKRAFDILLQSCIIYGDLRNDEAKRIDNSTTDTIFSNGSGVCRNYAAVNAGVFEVFKKFNPNLKNTYMRWYSPNDFGHLIALPHGWNQISTLKNTGNNLEILTTYVDPTWLDTRNRTASNTGEKLKISDEDIYDALDRSHFGYNALMAHEYAAGLYESLGPQTRVYSGKISEEKRGYYLKKGFEKRIEICNRVLDIAENNPADFKRCRVYLSESFKKAVEDIIGDRIEFLFKFGMEGKRDEKKFLELTRLYERASRLVPDYVNSGDLSYHSIDDTTYEDGTKGTLLFNQRKISIQTLFNKLKSEYSKP